MTKIETARKLLPKNRWVLRDVLVDGLNEVDLRTVRRLREYGWTINVKRDNGAIKYQRS